MNKYLIFLLLLSSAASAQRGGGDMDPYQNEAYARMVDSMALDVDQKAQFDTIEAQFRAASQAKRREARANGGDFALVRGEIQKLREGHHSVLASILTESQMKIYLEHVESVSQNRRRRRGE